MPQPIDYPPHVTRERAHTEDERNVIIAREHEMPAYISAGGKFLWKDYTGSLYAVKMLQDLAAARTKSIN